jgi:hypothetical protein
MYQYGYKQTAGNYVEVQVIAVIIASIVVIHAIVYLRKYLRINNEIGHLLNRQYCSIAN